METAGGSGHCPRIALLVQYDGAGFNGWQIQNGGRTVQGDIEKAIRILTGAESRLTAAGRTDSGVHALGQVAHFDCASNITLQRLCIGLSGILERDVSVKNAYAVPRDFHARYSAIAREYLYLIHNGRQRSPFMLNRAMWVHHPIDTEYLRAAVSHLVGEHDFASFCKKISTDGGTVRRIDSIGIERKEELIIIKIRGNAFLHNAICTGAVTIRIECARYSQNGTGITPVPQPHLAGYTSGGSNMRRLWSPSILRSCFNVIDIGRRISDSTPTAFRWSNILSYSDT
jgi:tRNA pseudouridine38-40 synthase